MGKIARGEYTLPSETMEALYRLNMQLGLLNDELTTENEELERFEGEVGEGENKGAFTMSVQNMAQFEFFHGKNGYLRKMDTVSKLGELLHESVIAQDGSTTTVFGILSEKDKQAQTDIEVIQHNLFVDGTDLLDKNAYGSYAKKYGVVREKDDPNDSVTAAEWIAEVKSDASSDGKSPTYFKDLARIIAARQLSNAVRHKKETLDAQLDRQQLLDRASELTHDMTFRLIMSQPEAVREIENCYRNPRSNGGALEDVLTRGLRRMKPGQLPNKTIYERYLPTVKERIEALKEMAKKGDARMSLRCAAEIVALRRTHNVARGDASSLKIAIQTDKLGSLRARTEELASDPAFQEAIKDPDMLAALKHGHGGRLVDLLPQKLNEARGRLERRALTDACKKLGLDPAQISPQSREGQIIRLRGEALKLAENLRPGKLDAMPEWERNVLLNRSKFMIAKYITLDMQCRDPQNRTALDPELLKQPAGDDAQVNDDAYAAQSSPQFQNMMDGLSDGDVLGLVTILPHLQQQDFMETLVQKTAVQRGAQPDAAERNEIIVEHVPRENQDHNEDVKLPN